jgi:hypothetical protein
VNYGLPGFTKKQRRAFHSYQIQSIASWSLVIPGGYNGELGKKREKKKAVPEFYAV